MMEALGRQHPDLVYAAYSAALDKVFECRLVVPADAGTHNHRRSCGTKELNDCFPKSRRSRLIGSRHIAGTTIDLTIDPSYSCPRYRRAP